MKNNNEILLEAKNLSLEIPLVDKIDQSLKKTFIRSITGGKIARNKNKTVIKALSNM